MNEIPVKDWMFYFSSVLILREKNGKNYETFYRPYIRQIINKKSQIYEKKLKFFTNREIIKFFFYLPQKTLIFNSTLHQNNG